MDEQRLISLRDEYLKNKDTYTPEQQEVMENKFGTLVQKAMEEIEVNKPHTEAKPRYEKVSEPEPQKPYRVSL